VNRRSLALLLLAAWVAALGWQAKRVYLPAAASRLAAGVRMLPPGTSYYAVYRDDLRAGWGQIEIDTLPGGSGFHVRGRVLLDLPSLGVPGRSERWSEEFLNSRLGLDSLTHLSVVGDDTVRIRMVSEGDSVVRLFDEAGAQAARIPISESVTTESGWRLRLAAAGRTETGRRYGVLVVDPLTAGTHLEEIEILEAAALAFPDSADTDSISGDWVVSREDTVQAWRVQSGRGAAERELWVDEDGRLVNGEIFGGLRVERTAFELAFFTRAASPLSRTQADDPPPEEPE